MVAHTSFWEDAFWNQKFYSKVKINSYPAYLIKEVSGTSAERFKKISQVASSNKQIREIWDNIKPGFLTYTRTKSNGPIKRNYSSELTSFDTFDKLTGKKRKMSSTYDRDDNDSGINSINDDPRFRS